MIQFIETSSITVHLDEVWNRAFIDIFSCKTFDKILAKNFCKAYFKAERVLYKNLFR
jgi:S-adenosylmethionine/arginine decarboxylase-like enzyme